MGFLLVRCYKFFCSNSLKRTWRRLLKSGREGAKYRAQVRIFQAGKLAYSEARTFEKRWQAEQWAEKREADAGSSATRRRKMQAERIDDSEQPV